MNRIGRMVLVLSTNLVLVGCGNLTPPKYENGQYIPPPAKHSLNIELIPSSCGTTGPPKALFMPLVTVVGTALLNQAYDRFVNWLDEKQANLSASSSGVTTTNFLVGKSPKRCLKLTRSNNLEVLLSIEPTETGGYWHMKPFSLKFTGSEAKEAPDGEKSIVADIQFATPGEDGKLATFFQATFDLGRRKANGQVDGAETFVGQDSGPYGIPKVAERDALVTMKVTASLVEHGDGRDWIRGVTNSLREQEHKDKILKPLLDALIKKDS